MPVYNEDVGHRETPQPYVTHHFLIVGYYNCGEDRVWWEGTARNVEEAILCSHIDRGTINSIFCDNVMMKPSVVSTRTWTL